MTWRRLGLAGETDRAGLTRRLVTLGLGALWLLDGVLQLQPIMFTKSVATQIIWNGIMMLPSAIYVPSLRLLVEYIVPSPALWNLCFAAIQLGIGVSLIFGRGKLLRGALVVSVVWGMSAWFFGEGMGGFLSTSMYGGTFPGTPSVISGFPGPALVYALGALVLLLPAEDWNPSHGFSWVTDAPIVFFLAMAVVQAAPLMWTSFGQSSIFLADKNNLPNQLAGTVTPIANFAIASPVFANLLEVGANILAALGVWATRETRWAAGLPLIWLAFIWWFGVGLGGILTGLGTDPGSPPAIALMMIPAIEFSRRRGT